MDFEKNYQPGKRVSAVQECKNRMAEARKKLEGVAGQQKVLEAIVLKNPQLNLLTNATRWRNAWQGKVADPEFTRLTEEVADELVQKVVSKKTPTRRIVRVSQRA